MNYRTLDKTELDRYRSQLMQTVISGRHVLHGNPFRPGIVTLFEEFGIWRPEFFNLLQQVLNLAPQPGLIVAKYVERNSMIELAKGYRLPHPLDFAAYKQLGFDLDFTGNGADNLLFDETCTWCIGTVVDVQFTGGTPEVLRLLAGSEEERLEKKQVFEEWAGEEGLLPAYRHMPEYVS